MAEGNVEENRCSSYAIRWKRKITNPGIALPVGMTVALALAGTHNMRIAFRF